MPEYESHSFEDVAEALKKVREQHKNGEPLVWTGPDRLHHSIAATSPEPSWFFSDDGMEYMRERGHDFWDVYTQVAFQLGFHNGTVREEKNTEFWKSSLERTQTMFDYLNNKEQDNS